MATKPAAGTYTVDTAHAKCPDHLYLFDEGSGSTLTDRGKTGGLNITLTGSPTWGTDDLGALGGAGADILTFNGSSQYGTSSSGLSINNGGNILLVAIYKTTDATPPGANETIAGCFNSANTTDFALARGQITTGYCATVYDDSAVAASAQNSGVSIYNQAWHFSAHRFYETGTPSIAVVAALDGGWASSSGSSGTNVIEALNRIGVAANRGSSGGAEFAGALTALFVYTNAADPTGTWNETFTDSLYADPWQFLTVTAATTYVKLLAEASAASAASIEGVVLNATRDTVIGEFSGQAFEAALESGEAVLLIDVADITPDGSTLTVSDTPIVFAYNATDSIIGPGSATVVEL